MTMLINYKSQTSISLCHKVWNTVHYIYFKIFLTHNDNSYLANIRKEIDTCRLKVTKHYVYELNTSLSLFNPCINSFF